MNLNTDFIELKSFQELLQEFNEKQSNSANNNYSNSGITSGFDSLDCITRGFQLSSLSIIGGAKGMGNFAFLTSLIKKMVVENKCPSALFLLDKTSNQFINRLVKQCDEINKNIDVPLKISDYSFRSIDEIARVIECFPTDTFKVMFIDSLQNIGLNKNDKIGKTLNKNEIGKITEKLKSIAQKNNIAIIALYEIQDIKRKKHLKRPTIFDVRKQVPLDYFADLILLLHRPEYYGIDDLVNDYGEEYSTSGKIEIIVVKNNFGDLGQVILQFIGHLSKVENLIENNFSNDTVCPAFHFSLPNGKAENQLE